MLHQRRSIRLKGYDYSRPGGYFITLCTQDRKRIFGKIVNGVFIPSEAGAMVARYWLQIEQDYENVKLDEYIFMPDHMHGIIWITQSGKAHQDKTGEAQTNGLQIKELQTEDAALVRAGPVPARIGPSLKAQEGEIKELQTEDAALVRADPVPAHLKEVGATSTVGAIVSAFKSKTTCCFIQNVKQNHWQPFNKRIWQRNYYEHIIRNTDELNRIREYIKDNPLKWELNQNRTKKSR